MVRCQIEGADVMPNTTFVVLKQTHVRVDSEVFLGIFRHLVCGMPDEGQSVRNSARASFAKISSLRGKGYCSACCSGFTAPL